ncbi:MAG: TIGR03564 family F420-dependent LLM class oxidoreductase [Deltaproteobacteria bacterium]|nr:TIGR03564 family F420-dependent LLM class oxidoreductase [Deltaproteobacteria bacterium]MBW2415193.1 TIGR03564 family F420-dependent LLM class oxidoreductase [Deltaproteobacteria bacterium]
MQIGYNSGAVGGRETRLQDLVDEARTAEARGFAFYGLANIFSYDAIGVLTVIGRETERIQTLTAVVPTPLRHPHAIAQQAVTCQAASGGRFSLGIGLSHQIVIENMMGLSYAKPAAQMREYLEVLAPLLRGEPASFQGDHYRVNASLAVAEGTPCPVLVAALGPRMLELTGRLASGTITWMTGVKTLGSFTVPTLRAAAEKAGNPPPRIVASLPVALVRDPDAARELAGKMFQMYGTLPSYRAMLDREGAGTPGDVAIVGDEASLRAQLRSLADAGVTEFSAACYPAEEGAVERTTDFLVSELGAYA